MEGVKQRRTGKPEGVKQRSTGKPEGWRGTSAERWDEECKTEETWQWSLRLKAKVDFKTKYSSNCLFIPTSCSLFPLSFTGLIRFIFSPSFIPSPSWSPLMKDGLDTMLVLSGLKCECLVCLFQVPASAADPWSLNQLHSPGNPYWVSHTWGMVLRIIVSMARCCCFPNFYWHLLLKMSICKEGDSYIRKLVTYRVTVRLHTALQWMQDRLPSFVIPSTP